mmetsp:Transcript_97629/g.280936  ORF Transcript_97629/g.280936 Transcript_97629/m.280936 type:complete len:248 (+) Transcript_97629:695-1438(+)
MVEAGVIAAPPLPPLAPVALRPKSWCAVVAGEGFARACACQRTGMGSFSGDSASESPMKNCCGPSLLGWGMPGSSQSAALAFGRAAAPDPVRLELRGGRWWTSMPLHCTRKAPVSSSCCPGIPSRASKPCGPMMSRSSLMTSWVMPMRTSTPCFSGTVVACGPCAIFPLLPDAGTPARCGLLTCSVGASAPPPRLSSRSMTTPSQVPSSWVLVLEKGARAQDWESGFSSSPVRAERSERIWSVTSGL